MLSKNDLRNFPTFKQIALNVDPFEGSSLYTKSSTNRAYVHNVGEEPLVYKNLGEQILECADRYAHRTALVACEENLRLTYADIRNAAERLAVHLLNEGLERGDHLGIWAPNISQWYIGFLAGVLGGFPVVCFNPVLQAPEMKYSLNKAKVKALLTMKDYGRLQFCKILDELYQDKTQKLPHLRFVLVKDRTKDREHYLDYDTFLARPVNKVQVKRLRENLIEISPESPCSLHFTSGTTGKPKAPLLTHFSLLNEAFEYGKILLLHESRKIMCLPVQFFHAFGLNVMLAAIQHGSTLVIPSLMFNASATLDVIEKERCNIVMGTPTMFVDMLEQQKKNPKCLDSLELGYVGGASVSPELYEKTKKHLSLKHLRIGYGATEMAGAVFAQDGSESLETLIFSVGKIFKNAEAKVINDKGETVPFGVPGELCMRGYFIMKGYYEDEMHTKEVLSTDGWYRTGDEFVLAANGVGKIVGRKKDMIIRGGENIYPKEIEDFLITHESILEIQVIGIPNQRLEEEVCAFIRLQPHAKILTAADINKFCQGKMAYFKIPRHVRIVDKFPKTNTGKIQKFKLKEML